MTHNIYLYILVMAGGDLFDSNAASGIVQKRLPAIISSLFLYYVPYACLAAMTFPAILYATASIYSALAGLVTAVIAAYRGKSLLIVALAACAAVFIAERILPFIQ